MNSLFDADEYGKSTRRPRASTPPQHTSGTIAVRADPTWRLVSSAQLGVVHAFVGVAGRKERNAGAMATFCGIVGVPRVFTPGELVQGCAACAAKGARVSER